MESSNNLGRSHDPVNQQRRLQFVTADPILKPSQTRVKNVIEPRYVKHSLESVQPGLNQIHNEGLNTNRGSYLPGVTPTNPSV